MKRIFSFFLLLIICIQSATMPFLSMKTYAFDMDKIKKGTINAGDVIKKNADKAGDITKEFAGKTGKAAKESVDNIGKSTKEVTDKAAKSAKETTDNLSKRADDVGKDLSDKAEKAYGSASLAAKEIESNISDYIASIDTEKFKAGWDYASKYTGTAIASLKGASYVHSVEKSIEQTSSLMQAHLKEKVVSGRTVNQDAGFAAEIWHTDSFNLEAALNGSEFKAIRPDSNGKASADVTISGKNYSQDYSLKYYSDAESSAKAQAKTFYADYQEQYAHNKRHGNKTLTVEEYLDKYDKSLDSLYDSLYSGQGKIIPSDQLDDAREYLTKKKLKVDMGDNDYRKKFSPGLKESLDTLAARIEAPDGTSSIPLTEKQAKELVELTRDNKDLDIKDFNVKPSQLITTKYILKQAVSAGAQDAIISSAFAIGPDVYAIIVDAAKEGKIDENKLKEVGIEGVLAGSEGFVEGSISSAIVIACQSGKFGASYTNIAPETVGTLTVLVIDAIRYGYQLSTGEITETEYADLMAQDIIIAIASQASGALVFALFPYVPFSYMVGSMAGAMLASVGYAAGKDLILQVRGENGFETVVPDTLVKGQSLTSSFMKRIKFEKTISDFKNTTVTALENGKIKIDLAS